MSNFNLRSNFTSRCKVKYFDEGEKWWCPKQLSGQFDKEDTHCYLSVCPGRELTDKEEDERLLKIEERILAQNKKKKSNTDPLEKLFKKIEKIAKKEIDAENLDPKKPIKKTATIKKEPSRVIQLQEVQQEPIIVEPLKQEPVIVEPVVVEPLEQEPVIVEPLKQEPVIVEPTKVQLAILEQESNVVDLEQESSIVNNPPLGQELKKCQWRLCDQYFAIGVGSSKKEKFCCPKCRKKDSRSRWRDRKRELGFVPN